MLGQGQGEGVGWGRVRVRVRRVRRDQLRLALSELAIVTGLQRQPRVGLVDLT